MTQRVKPLHTINASKTYEIKVPQGSLKKKDFAFVTVHLYSGLIFIKVGEMCVCVCLCHVGVQACVECYATARAQSSNLRSSSLGHLTGSHWGQDGRLDSKSIRPHPHTHFSLPPSVQISPKSTSAVSLQYLLVLLFVDVPVLHMLLRAGITSSVSLDFSPMSWSFSYVLCQYNHVMTM